MARLSDIIESLLKDMLEENQGCIEITRGELASRVNCVPSQITYVLTTRFTNGQGYFVESRRGGGGWIRIQRIAHQSNKSQQLMHILNSLDVALSQQDIEVYLRNFVQFDLLPKETTRLIFSAISDNTLLGIVPTKRDEIRTDIFKNMLIQVILNDEGTENA